jgi:hypothetical protein
MPILSHPAAAWLFPAVALPILFHLFFRLRRQVRDFPALLFFQRIDPRLSAKRKIHEWLILFLRCLFIALLLAALLRPLMGNHATGGSLARLVLIDNSGSMAGAARQNLSKFELAKNATLHLISSLPPGDTVAVQLAVPDPTAALPDGFDTSAAVLRDAVGKLVVSDGGASVPQALRRALALLETSKAARRELIVITDLQRDNWTRGEIAAEPTTSLVTVRRIATASPAGGSVAFSDHGAPARALPINRITPLTASLRNDGTATAHARLNSNDDAGRNQTFDLILPPHGTSTPTLTFSFPTPGFHWAELWLEGDTAATATRCELGFWCTDVRQVLFVGTPADFGTLPYAVSPGGNSALTGLDSVYVNPAQVAAALRAKPLAVVSTWNQIDPGLEDYVRQGGTLLLVPRSTGANAASTPAWIGAQLGNLHQAVVPEPILALEDGDPIWHDLRDGSGRPQLGTVRAFQYRPILAAGPEWRPLLAAGQGGTLLARREFGQGHLLASGLAFTPQESSLPLKAAFVVLVQNAIFGERSESLPVRLTQAGDPVDLAGDSVTIKSLAGSALAWSGAGRNFPGFPHAGIYEIQQGDHTEWIAASANASEAHPDFLPLAAIPLLHNLPHEVEPLTGEDDLTSIDSTSAGAASLYRWLLLTALLVLLAETWVANERSSDFGRQLFNSLARRTKPAAKKAASPA